MRNLSRQQAPADHLAAGIALTMLALTLVAGVECALPQANALAAQLTTPTPTGTLGARGDTAIPCLIVATSGCPQAASATPISVLSPGTVVVTGANWAPGADVTVLLVAAVQSCAAAPAASTQARASIAGVFSVALRLPASAPNGALYGLCAATAGNKQTFPTAGLTVPSPLRLRIMRVQQPAAPAPVPPIDGFSLAALVLAALSAGVFVYSWLRRRSAKVSTDG